MAAPTVIANSNQILQESFKNVHSIVEGDLGNNLKVRLQTWKDLFFPILDKSILAENNSLIWFVPTVAQINSMIEANIVSYMDPIVNLLLNTAFAWGQYNFPPDKEAAIVAAFNTAWT